MTKKALIILAKNPEAGKVKTRLAATIGNEAALSVYTKLLSHTVTVTEYLPMDKYVYYSEHITKEDVWNNQQYSKRLQQGNDLGEKMQHAFANVFKEGYEKVVLIGTDCPELTGTILSDAFDKLDEKDVVIGPAFDGGYYLIGLQNNCPLLFEDITWSTNSVLAKTINKCKSIGLSFTLLQSLQDIDEEKDLIKSKLQWQ